jgi:hypothetical protein
MEKWLPVWRVAVNVYNKQSQTADIGWFSSLGVERDAKSHNLPCCELFHKIPDLGCSCGICKQRKRDTRFSMWNVRSLYRSG